MRLPPAVEQKRSVAASIDRLVDRLVRARVQRDFSGLVALADDPQNGLVAGATEIADIRTARFRHPQSVESEQAHQRVAVAGVGLGRGEQVGQFIAVQPGAVAARACVDVGRARRGCRG
jgi:hypothetical protein